MEGAWPALVSRDLFDAVQQAMRDRAPKVQRPGRVGSKFLLSGLLKCGVCGRPYSGQGAKSGQFAYYVCGTLFREGAGTCSARYLNAPRVEDFIVEKIRERILTEETIVELVTLVAEEIDAMARDLSGRLEVIEAELGDVRKRLERLYEALETSEFTLEVLSPRIFSLRHREEQMEAAREDAETQLEQRRVELPTTEEIKGYVADFREFLQEGTFPERKALIRNFVEGIEVVGDEATLTYTVPMPKDGVKRESASVLDFVQSGPPDFTVLRTRPFRATSAVSAPPMRVKLQLGALLRPVLDVDLPIAVGGVGGDPEAARSGFPHPPRHLLGEILAVELVHAFDDGLKELAGGGVVSLLGDGDDPDAAPPQHGLEGDGVLALSGEAGELPDEDFLERGLRLGGLVQHPLELGPVGDASALGLVHVLAGDQVAVLLGVFSESP